MSYEIIKDEPLSRHTLFAIGGPAKLFVRARNREDMIEAVKLVHKEGMPFAILGGGSNVLVGDNGFDGIVVVNEDRSLTFEGERIIVSSGALLAALSRSASEKGLSGLEWAFGIPGTVGGAVRGNAGAFGGETKDVIESVEIVDVHTGEIKTFLAKEMAFAYRTSIFVRHPEWMILTATYRLLRGDPAVTMEKMKHCFSLKRTSQPLGAHCAGSMFKNTPIALFEDTSSFPAEYIRKGAIPSGYLIERVGLKGYEIGRVKISEKHANFFINTGGARCEEMLQLIGLAKKKVFETFGVLLTEEIQYIDAQ